MIDRLGAGVNQLSGSSETQFRALLETAPDAMVIVDQDGRIALVNTQTERLFGYARHELLDQRIEVLIPERFRASHEGRRVAYQREPRVRPMGAGFTLFGRRKDCTEFPVEISLSPLDTDRGRLVTAAIRDVTDRRRVEQALQDKTSSSADQDVLETYKLHASCYVVKPVGLNEFLTIVSSIEDFWLTIVKLPPHGEALP